MSLFSFLIRLTYSRMPLFRASRRTVADFRAADALWTDRCLLHRALASRYVKFGRAADRVPLKVGL